jgi:hypothetical protein
VVIDEMIREHGGEPEEVKEKDDNEAQMRELFG